MGDPEKHRAKRVVDVAIMDISVVEIDNEKLLKQSTQKNAFSNRSRSFADSSQPDKIEPLYDFGAQ